MRQTILDFHTKKSRARDQICHIEWTFSFNHGAAIFVCEISSLNVAMRIACARNFIVIFVDERSSAYFSVG